MEKAKTDEPTKSKSSSKESNKTKYLLFKCGPTGSGKSNVEFVIDNYFKKTKEFKKNIFTHKDTVNLSIDDLVERNPYFKNGIDNIFEKIISKAKSKIKKEIKKEIKAEGVVTEKTRKEKLKSLKSIANERIIKILLEMFEDPTTDLIDELNIIYENARINTSCINGMQTGKITRQTAKTIKDSCENLRDQLLQQALDQDKNIVFERTGKDFPTKLLSKFPKLQEYTIVFCWSVVDVCELLHRNRERVIVKLEQYFKIKENSPVKYNDVNSFLKSKILPIPRLPDTNEIKYKKSLLDIINTFNLYFYNKDNYRQLIIDNNYEPLIVYDNKYNSSTKKSNPMSRYNIDEQCNI
tara:strand:+ start:5017 stop:6072 length:1056 start_codon:yes stop_codon:yes gene_type:complete